MIRQFDILHLIFRPVSLYFIFLDTRVKYFEALDSLIFFSRISIMIILINRYTKYFPDVLQAKSVLYCDTYFIFINSLRIFRS